MTNQASEDKIEEELQAIFDGYNGLIDHEYQGTAYDRTDAINAIKAIIRTEKLKLLDRLSSHQEDLFWWTGGEYEKTKAVDMRAIAAERELLTKLKERDDEYVEIIKKRLAANKGEK